jgi:adenosine deaminase
MTTPSTSTPSMRAPAPATLPTLADVTALPKLELHIHLEGTIAPALVQTLAAQQGKTLPRPLESLYATDDLGAFLATLDWVCSLVTSTEQAQAIADNFGRYCVEQHIVYAEVIVNPTHWQGLRYQALFPALSAAFDAVQQHYAVDVRLLPSILRQQSREEALALVTWMGNARVPRIVGLSIDGNEKSAGRTSERFAPAYAMARELGFGLTSHAGESSGAEGVRDAMDLLKVDRLDHGIRVIEDAALTQRVAECGLTLNVCLSSNCTLLYGSIDKHPFNALRAAGVKMTLNTDDPAVLNTDLCRELHWAAQQLQLDLATLAEFQRQAVHAAFCDAATKTRLLTILNQPL